MAKPMVEIKADLTGIAAYTGAVGGILAGIQSPRFQGDFAKYTLKEVRKHFMADTIAAGLAGNRSLQHVFEWPMQDQRGVSTGTPSGIPLFKLKIVGQKEFRVLTFDYLPSTRPVPLPDPDYYGFKPNKLQYLRRHTFTWKALVMESSAQVSIAPRGNKRLFIPSTNNKYGYFMTTKTQSINPGGPQATGGFTRWWGAWFEGVAPMHVKQAGTKAAEVIAKTGQKVVRDAVTGRFAKGKVVTMGYINAEKRTAELKMQKMASYVFNEDDDEDWDE